MTNDELKPCPFCGSSVFAITVDGIELASCSNEGCIVWANMRPISEWNTRPIEDKLMAEIERLMGALDNIMGKTTDTKAWKIANDALEGGAK